MYSLSLRMQIHINTLVLRHHIMIINVSFLEITFYRPTPRKEMPLHEEHQPVIGTEMNIHTNIFLNISIHACSYTCLEVQCTLTLSFHRCDYFFTHFLHVERAHRECTPVPGSLNSYCPHQRWLTEGSRISTIQDAGTV